MRPARTKRTKGPSTVWLAWWDAPHSNTLWFASKHAAEAFVRDLPGARIAGPYAKRSTGVESR